MDEKSETELVASARSGDRNSFGVLIERHRNMALRVARGVIEDLDTARDLAQEAVLQAYLSLDRLRNPERFQSWLYGIVLNVCRSYIRDQKTAFYSLEAMTGGLHLESLPVSDLEPDPQEVAEAQELHETVLGAVDGLSPKVRAATLMFYYEQLSTQEIAATLGISVVAIKGRLHRARGQLREMLWPAVREMRGTLPQKERKQEERNMVEVIIADIMASEGSKDEESGKTHRQNVVVLLDKKGRRVLPIWIGPQEAQAIAIALRDVEVPRPLTYGFTARLLEAAGATLDEVRVQALKGDTFYAVAIITGGDDVREVDARPSDAMALAVITGCPIYVAEEVMEKAGEDIPKEVSELEPLGKGIDRIAGTFEQEVGRSQRKSEESAEEKAERIKAARRAAERRITGPFVAEDESESTG